MGRWALHCLFGRKYSSDLFLLSGSAKADALNSTFFIEADQFDEYQVNQGSSVALGFPMREFKVSKGFSQRTRIS